MLPVKKKKKKKKKKDLQKNWRIKKEKRVQAAYYSNVIYWKKIRKQHSSLEGDLF